MKLLNFIILKICIFSFILCNSQEFFVQKKADIIKTDNLNYFYLIHFDGIYKYNQKGELLFQYHNKNFGKIDYIDVSNPMKILIFYKAQSIVLFLDNTLNENGNSINLQDLNFISPQIVCTSYDNGLWVYDQSSMQLTRLDKSLKVTHQTPNLNQLLNIKTLPINLIEKNNYLYLQVPDKGLIVFDNYANYFKTIPVKNIKSFQIKGDNLFYLQKNTIFVYNFKTLEKKVIMSFDNDVIDFSLSNPSTNSKNDNLLFYINNNKNVLYIKF